MGHTDLTLIRCWSAQDDTVYACAGYTAAGTRAIRPRTGRGADPDRRQQRRGGDLEPRCANEQGLTHEQQAAPALPPVIPGVDFFESLRAANEAVATQHRTANG